jgi:DNA-binding transcriptional regulator PaaX
MEKNFDPNKEGDYKYILQEEGRKETSEAESSVISSKRTRFDRLWKWIIVGLLRSVKQAKQPKLSIPLLLEFLG